MTKSLWNSKWTVSIYDEEGRLLSHACGGNIFHRQGEEYLLKRAFAGETQPPSLYVGLDNRTALAEADTLATVVANGEPVGDGYARAEVPLGSVTLGQDGSGNWTGTFPAVTFTHASSGSAWSVANAFLATSADGTGKLLCSKALPSPPGGGVLPGQSLVVTVNITIAEPA